MEKVFLGARAGRLLPGLEALPITKVELLDSDGELLAKAGTDDGRTVTATHPDATQAMADSILAKLSGYRYQPYEAQEAMLDPASELGDGVTVGGMYSVLAKAAHIFGPLHLADISAPAADETEDEYPYKNTVERAIARSAKTTRSLITKTAGEIRLEVMNEVEGLSAAIEVDLTEIIGRVEDAEAGLSQTVRLGADGLTITNAKGETLEIDGGQLKANSIEAEAFKANSITADKLSITGSISWTDLATDAQNQVTSAQNMSLSAYNLANSASNTANAVGSRVDGWTYSGTTYIDGAKLMTGTVMASKLLGGTVGLLDANQTVIGGIALSYTTTGLGMDMYTSYGGMRMRSAGNFYAEAASGPFLQLGVGDGTVPVCQLGGGPLVISSYSYGTSLPATGVQGQVFFLLGG